MKRLLLIACVALGFGVAACSGGGSTGGTPPTQGPAPTSTPTTAPVSYTARLVFTGALAGKQEIQSDLRRIALDSGASPPPIGLGAPIAVVDGVPQAGSSRAWDTGQIEVMVSPEPSTTPTISYSVTGDNLAIQTPNPSQSPNPLPSGVYARQYVGVSPSSSPNAQASGIASADISAPVSATPTTPWYLLKQISLECQFSNTVNPGVNDPGSQPGWTYDATTNSWNAATSLATADIYMTGSHCFSPGYSDANDYLTIHVPGGDVRFTTDTSYFAIAASQWANSETSFILDPTELVQADLSYDAIVLGKTRDGSHTFLLFPATMSANEFTGEIQVSGAGVNGF